MAYNKTEDLESIQADVLTTDTTDNTKIAKLKQLKTDTKVPTKAINALNEQLGNAQESASDALQRVVAVEAELTALKDLQPVTSGDAQVVVVHDMGVGSVTWQMRLLDDHLMLNGDTVVGADYPELLAFVVDHQLLTTSADDKSLFAYDEATGELTLPDYVGLVMQGGTTVETVAAGLPNIEGTFTKMFHTAENNSGNGAFADSISNGQAGYLNGPANSSYDWVGVKFKASNFNSIYGNADTVQPPAIRLIPQIRCRTAVNGVANAKPLTTEQVESLVNGFGQRNGGEQRE